MVKEVKKQQKNLIQIHNMDALIPLNAATLSEEGKKRAISDLLNRSKIGQLRPTKAQMEQNNENI